MPTRGKKKMFSETIDMLANAGAAKVRMLRDRPTAFLISSAMAGIYVGFAILMIFSLGSALDPSVRSLVMGATFGLALVLVVFAGSDLFTGHTMMATIALLERRITVRQLLGDWSACWTGNLIGALLLAALFVAGGGGLITHGDSDLIYKAAAAKMSAGAAPLFFRAILCNWLVCLALWMSSRIESETARMIAIAWCLFAFVASGYEHSVANKTVFPVALLSSHPESVTWAGAAWNLLWVTLGNSVAGAFFMATLPWLASLKPATVREVEPALAAAE
jgi:nitrite transporter NirC